jgi:flagellar protein FliS
MTQQSAAATYRRNAVLTSTPEKLVKLLYDGAIRNLERGKEGVTNPATIRSAEVGTALSNAIAILGELRAALDHEVGGEISQNLDRLYEFGIDRVSHANLTRTAAPIDDTLSVLRTLKEAWDAVVPAS